MSNQSCIFGKQKVSEENLADFGFRSESGKIEKFAISAGTEKNASICCSNSTVHVVVERLQKAQKLWWAADERQDLEEAISANQNKTLS